MCGGPRLPRSPAYKCVHYQTHLGISTDSKAKKAAADKRKAAAASEATTAAGTKASDATKPPTKKLWCDPPRRFLLPVIQIHASPRAATMAKVGAYRHERSIREFDPPRRAGQIQTRTTSQTVKPRSLHEGRHPPPARLPLHRSATLRSMRSLGTRLQHPLHLPHIEIEIEIVYNMYRIRRFATNTVCAGCCLSALPTMPYRKLTSQG
jgi:hypothetical protein